MRYNMAMEAKKLYRSKTNRMIAGVCGGIADYFNIDPVIVRLGAVLLLLITGGAALVGYIVLWVIVPEADADSGATPTDSSKK